MKRAMQWCGMLGVLVVIAIGAWWYARAPRHAREATARQEIAITFVEGRTLKEYGAVLVARGIVSSVDAWRHSVAIIAPRYRVLFPALFADAPAGASLEGYFFPDTYRVYQDTNPRRIIEKALSAMNEKVVALAGNNRTIFETLTMASVVEAEGKTAEDRALIADILWRRLSAGMLLQVDSSPLTYTMKGLPSAPLNNPSWESINAAAHPTHNEYWYFLSGRDGAMHYARTLEEHQKNIARYLR